MVFFKKIYRNQGIPQGKNTLEKTKNSKKLKENIFKIIA